MRHHQSGEALVIVIGGAKQGYVLLPNRRDCGPVSLAIGKGTHLQPRALPTHTPKAKAGRSKTWCEIAHSAGRGRDCLRACAGPNRAAQPSGPVTLDHWDALEAAGTCFPSPHAMPCGPVCRKYRSQVAQKV